MKKLHPCITHHPATTKGFVVYINQLVVDVDDVLFDSTCWDRWLHRFLSRFGVVGSYVCHAKVWGIDHLPAVYRGEIDYWDALRLYLHTLGLNVGQAEEFIAASRMQRKSLLESKRVYPDARTGLYQLSGVMPVTLVANTFQSSQQMSVFLKRFGFSENMFSVITSRDTGHSISEAGFFQHILDQLAPDTTDKIGMVSASKLALSEASRIGLTPIAIATEDVCGIEQKYERFEQVAVELYKLPQQSRSAA